MRRRTLHRLGRLLVASLLGLAAPAQAQAPAPFDVKVTFEGLIAFVEDKDAAGKDVVWALLVDADYDPNSFTADDVPPCAWAEVPPDRDPKIELPKLYPPHKAWIAFKNAKDVSGTFSTSRLEQGFPIQGEDLRFISGLSPGLTGVDLAAHANAKEMGDSRRNPEAVYQYLDKSHPDPVALDWATAKGRLAARVLLEAGVGPKGVKDCGGAGCRQFGFKAPSESHFDCFGTTALEKVELAETTQWTLPSVLRSLKLDGLAGSPLELQPVNPAAPLTIKILNSVDVIDPFANHYHDSHYQGFRWYYRLSDATWSATDCRGHFWPCVIEEPAGGNKCPQRLFTH